MESIEENELLYRKWVNEIWNHGNEKTIDELLDENAVVHFPHIAFGNEMIRGREEFKNFVRDFRLRYKTLTARVEDLVVNGEKVIALSRLDGTYIDDIGIEVPISSKALCSIVFREGKIVELWNNVEMNLAQRTPAIHDSSSAKR